MSKPLGLFCEGCGRKLERTLETRSVPGAIRRIKPCVRCGEKHVTIETLAGKPRKRRKRVAA